MTDKFSSASRKGFPDVWEGEARETTYLPDEVNLPLVQFVVALE